jgi:hypothetical protein
MKTRLCFVLARILQSPPIWTEYVGPIAIPNRMLFPNERVRHDREQIARVIRAKRPQFNEGASHRGLKIKRHLLKLAITSPP